ncbi:MAG: hypothetical protein PF495_02635, partial [Spirochaetales bacterium]|nr:hypothetical protein [Spirochaetales bacterium]
IFLALVFNISGAYKAVSDTVAVQGIASGLGMIAAATSPLILLIIGYQLKIEREGFFDSIKIIALRVALIAVLGTVFILITDRLILDVDKIMLYAFITFLVLPPPFILPIFLPKRAQRENRIYNNSIVMYTFLTLIVFSVIMFFIG